MLKEATIVFVLLCVVTIAVGGCGKLSTIREGRDAVARTDVSQAVNEIIDGDRDKQERVISITEDVRSCIGSEPEARTESIMRLMDWIEQAAYSAEVD